LFYSSLILHGVQKIIDELNLYNEYCIQRIKYGKNNNSCCGIHSKNRIINIYPSAPRYEDIEIKLLNKKRKNKKNKSAKNSITILGSVHKKDIILNSKIEIINRFKMDTLNIEEDDEEEDKKLIMPKNNINKDIITYINNFQNQSQTPHQIQSYQLEIWLTNITG